MYCAEQRTEERQQSKMFRHKLDALEYHSTETINIDKQDDLKALVVWLEDQKIRHYKIEQRSDLRSHTGDKWKSTFKKYLTDLECPHDLETDLHAAVDWLLGVAVRYDFGDAAQEHHQLRCGLNYTEKQAKLPLPSQKSALDIDPSDKVFISGVQALAKIVQVTRHPDPSVLLEAVRIVIEERLSESAVETAKSKGASAKEKTPNKQYNITAKDCGFDLGDPVLNEAAKVLRLLHIQELRYLQTNINELIVAVQRITANPKTDQSLGRVGV